MIDTSFLMSADDVIHVSASDFYAWKNVVISGNAGAVAMLGSYNLGLNSGNIQGSTVDGVFVARASRGDRSDNWARQAGIVDTMSCMERPLALKKIAVKNLVVAGLGADSGGKQLQQVDRLFSISANNRDKSGADNNCYAGDKTASQPDFDITLDNFDVKENQGNDWQSDSNQCNYVCSGAQCTWSVTLIGKDLESQKGKMCPW